MVKVKEKSYLLADGTIDSESWIDTLKPRYHQLTLIRHACTLADLAGTEHKTLTGQSCLQAGLAMAEILLDLEVDTETLAAAIIYDTVRYTDISLDDVEAQLGKKTAQLVLGVQRMDAVNLVRYEEQNAIHQQMDNLRKMFLAMVDDVRGVLIKLAEQLSILRMANVLEEATRKSIAQETKNIYAPLANRLGVGTIKWEMEDLAFRYLQSNEYKKIAKGLKARRLDRDNYVKNIVELLNSELKKIGLNDYKVYGRSKHIHSIYRKMQQKNRSLDEIYDATAVRILVNTTQECYAVLSLVHHLWKPIPTEFDDYITQPKQNGYQSLHTAVIGPEDKHFEVQIRTREMHDFAELGIAAHWKYKEGTTNIKEAHERKIEWLREVLDWHKELAQMENALESEKNTPIMHRPEFFEDRVYVFTPKGKILDLPQGATPLDFAYHIHSNVGHRCRGAKVNGHMVNLSYVLQMGEQVEILTGNKEQPSRDWINPHLGYLKSSRARAKVLQWYKEQDFERHQTDGEALLEREFKKLNIRSVSIEDLSKQFKFKKKEDFFAALGRGDLKISAVLQKTIHADTVIKPTKIAVPLKTDYKVEHPEDIYIEGVGNLLTHMANCCKPSINDPIVGYVTIGRGISIHNQNCPNILDLSENDRLVQVSWGKKACTHYPIELEMEAYDRPGLIRDVTQVMAFEQVNLIQFNTVVDKEAHKAHVTLTAEVDAVETLSRLIEKLQHISNVIHVNVKRF